MTDPAARRAEFSVAVERLDELSPEARDALMRRSETDIADLAGYVAPLIERVRADGDAAVRALTGEFDGVDLGARPLRATQAEFDAAARALPEDLIAAIDVAVANVKKGHEDQLIDGETHREIRTETVPGVIVGERTRPLQSVALYVPRGKGSFPSVAIMLCAPAVVAGVARPIVVTPPGPNGDVDAATLVAAQKTGVTEVYRVGGVQAIAALAFGTGEIPRTPKVLGPGNAYVTAAKRALAGVIDPGVPAGPSESAILCDGTIHADIAAHDLLIEAEHGPDSCAVLVATSRDYARAVAARLPALVAALPEQRQAFITENFRERSKILVASDLDAAIEFVNEFAPEHLEILSDDAEALLERIENAGETMLGPHAPITLGNFVAGSNAILPTGGLARSASCLGVPDFQKRSSFVMASREGFERLAPAALTLADYEGFPAHAAAVRRRLS